MIHVTSTTTWIKSLHFRAAIVRMPDHNNGNEAKRLTTLSSSHPYFLQPGCGELNSRSCLSSFHPCMWSVQDVLTFSGSTSSPSSLTHVNCSVFVNFFQIFSCWAVHSRRWIPTCISILYGCNTKYPQTRNFQEHYVLTVLETKHEIRVWLPQIFSWLIERASCHVL